jgi:hypothetical protein
MTCVHLVGLGLRPVVTTSDNCIDVTNATLLFPKLFSTFDILRLPLSM